jgi:multiple sugar transport system substrate-binding protein
MSIISVLVLTGSGKEEVVGEKETVTIGAIHWGNGGQEFWNSLNNDFMAEYPWIKFEQEFAEYSQVWPKIGGYITTGKGPDMAVFENGLSLFKYNDVLVDLRGKVDDILPDVSGLGTCYLNFDTNDKLLAVPMGINGHMAYYNKQVFKDAGLNPERPPSTWSEFDDAIKSIKAAGMEGFAMGAKQFGILWTWSDLCHQTMSYEEQLGLFKGTESWTDKDGGWAKVVYLLDDMYKRGWFNEGAASTSVIPEAMDMFINGEAAFFNSLMGDFANWKVWGDTMGYENFGVVKFPIMEKNFPLKGSSPGPLAETVPTWGVWATGVFNWSENVDEAALYLKYLSRPDIQERMVLEGGFFPNTQEFDASLVDAPQFQTLVEWSREAITHPALYYCTPEEWDAFMRNTQLLLSDQITVDEFLEDMQRVHDESKQN